MKASNNLFIVIIVLFTGCASPKNETILSESAWYFWGKKTPDNEQVVVDANLYRIEYFKGNHDYRYCWVSNETKKWECFEPKNSYDVICPIPPKWSVRGDTLFYSCNKMLIHAITQDSLVLCHAWVSEKERAYAIYKRIKL